MIFITAKKIEATAPFFLSKNDVKNYNRMFQNVVLKKNILLINTNHEISGFFDSGDNISEVNFSDFQKKIGKDKKYDLIISDLIFNSVPYNQLEKTIYSLKHHISEGGFLLTRAHYISPEIGLDFIKEKYENCLKKIFQYNDFEFSIFLAGMFLNLSVDLGASLPEFNYNKKIAKDMFFDFMAEVEERLDMRQKKILLTADCIIDNFPKFYSVPLLNLDKLITDNFIIKDLKLSFDYLGSEFFPIYALKKGNNENTFY
jgi:hypothetical protein